jgi:hypothetical protein
MFKNRVDLYFKKKLQQDGLHNHNDAIDGRDLKAKMHEAELKQLNRWLKQVKTRQGVRYK